MKPVVSQCIIPVAGMGKRWQPISNLYPKELLPIGRLPLLAYILAEVAIAEINQVILVVSEEKKQFFLKFIDLIETSPQLKSLKLNSLSFSLVLQKPLKNKLGLGAAVYSAKEFIFNQDSDQHCSHFALLLPDVLLNSGHYLKQMKDSLLTHSDNLIALNQVDPAQVSNYGIAKFKQSQGTSLNGQIDSLIEKPNQDQSPSNFAVLGRYLLSFDIFNALENSEAGSGDEIQITDAINRLSNNQKILANHYTLSQFDCGKVDGFVDAVKNFNQESFFSN